MTTPPYAAILAEWGINPEPQPQLALYAINGYDLVKEFFATYKPFYVSQKDATYYTCSRTDLRRWLGWDRTYTLWYIPDEPWSNKTGGQPSFDCDDFQETMIVHAAHSGLTAMFGIRTRHPTGANHAFCGIPVMEEDGTLSLVFIEPQANAIVPPLPDTLYDPMNAEVIT